MAALAHAYRYLTESSLAGSGDRRLSLATSGPGDQSHPHFFEGRVLKPRLVAQLLTALHAVVGARFFTPANTVSRLVALADPVVTAGGRVLRFEGFSGCCSTYVRVDLLPDGYDGELVGKGTTNVDFNAPMRAALAQVRDSDTLALAVGSDQVALRVGAREVIERKVDLPERWIRGLLESQSYLAATRKRFDVPGVEALRFLRALPRASTSRTPLWAAHGQRGLFTSTLMQDDAVRLTDSRRLRVLEPLASQASSLAAYADDAHQCSVWVLAFPGARLTLALSAEVWRGFSGEGQALRALMRAAGDTGAPLAAVRAQLAWQASIDAPALARELGRARDEIEQSLRVLGVSGLVGFDVVEGTYFHRVLPFDLALAEDMHPRLAAARELLEGGAVALATRSPLEAVVTSAGAEHRVREVEGLLRCTCPWFAKHQGQRGPCKHVLAVEAFAGQAG